MKRFTKVKSIITPLEKANVDTDQIIPKQFLKLVKKTGFGKYLFFNWRFDKMGEPNSSFVLNNPKYKNSKILVTGENFGCGSSREHAVWGLLDFGFSVVIAASFADIFYSNCFKNGLFPLKLESKKVENLKKIESEIEVDLVKQIIKTETEAIPFEVNEFKKKILLEGLDDIDLTLQYEYKIREFEKNTRTPSVL